MRLNSIIHRPHQENSVRYHKMSVRPYSQISDLKATGMLLIGPPPIRLAVLHPKYLPFWRRRELLENLLTGPPDPLLLSPFVWNFYHYYSDFGSCCLWIYDRLTIRSCRRPEKRETWTYSL